METANHRTSYWFYVWTVLILLGCCWAFLQWNHPLAERARNNLEAVIDRPINWNVLTDLYSKYVDSAPVAVPNTETQPSSATHSVSGTLHSLRMPAKGNVWMPFDERRMGVIYRTSQQAIVSASADGRVIQVETMPGIGNTAVIQHAGGMQTWYGMLAEIKVEKNDWVSASEQIGVTTTGAESNGFFYFALKDADRFVNPTEVIHSE